MELVENDILTDSIVFKGEEHNPFLAPRGVWMHEGKLLVSDTGQNRLFIWNELPKSEFQKADVTLGQVNSTETGRNSNTGVTASTLQYPSGVWTDGSQLILADAWNHRVLIWKEFPTKDGQAADVVIGQPDFESNLPNEKGIGKNPSACTLNWPYGVHSDGRQLWIADTGNRRVLYFKSIPNQNFTPADEVIGKPGFDTRDYESDDAIWPYSVRVSDTGSMSITDTQYYRVLLWNQWETALSSKADVIIGQNSFGENGQNQFLMKPSANTLNWCYDSFFSEDGIWIADTGNSRILRFNKLPERNNKSADDLLGHQDFHTGSENAQTITSTEKALYWPFSICVVQNTMAIADTGNHRIILKRLHT
ncbi:MAG: hypothetical protein AAF363_09670 [Bacteroidota bacterium]